MLNAILEAIRAAAAAIERHYQIHYADYGYIYSDDITVTGTLEGNQAVFRANIIGRHGRENFVVKTIDIL